MSLRAPSSLRHSAYCLLERDELPSGGSLFKVYSPSIRQQFSSQELMSFEQVISKARRLIRGQATLRPDVSRSVMNGETTLRQFSESCFRCGMVGHSGDNCQRTENRTGLPMTANGQPNLSRPEQQ